MNIFALIQTPVTFKVDALGGATLALGFKGDYDGKYTLSINETAFDDLPEFKEKIEMPEVGHSIAERHNGP